MTRENKELKAFRLINEKKVKLKSKGLHLIIFEVQGDHETYEVLYDVRSEEWRCPCRSGGIKPLIECSHILASKMLLKTL